MTTAGVSTGYRYDGASRLSRVLDGANTVGYSYVANSPFVGQIAFTNNGVQRMVTTKTHDYVNRLTGIASSGTGFQPVSFSYTYNSASQRTGVTNADSSYWVYTYDSMGQATSGRKYFSDGTPVAGQQFDYAFDDIGNRQTTTRDTRQAWYTNNLLNQITGRTVPGYVNVLGTATNTATVTVNNTPTARKGDYYRTELAVMNGATPVWLGVTNIAVLNQGANPDIVATVTGNVLVARSPEISGYDADGNLTNDGRWVFTWDAENRLKQVESLASGPTASKRKVVWEFDARGRRIRQTTYDGSSGSYVVTEDLKFLSDGWAHVAELNATNNALVRSYAWGLDLSGSQAGAGGVGGLLIVNSAANGTHFCAYDGNGNVAALVKATDGTEAARYEYGPFGEPIRATGMMAKENPFRFSTKRTDNTTDFVMYEYRLYSPNAGRWLSRDPAGETDANSFLFVENGAISNYDLLGLWTTPVHRDRTTEWARALAFPNDAAAAIGAADEAVDGMGVGGTGPVPWGDQGYHFNRPARGAPDSRLRHSEEHFRLAVGHCSSPSDEPQAAATELGRALHPLQDYVAHGDHFISNPGNIFDLAAHNGRSPQRDLLASHGSPNHYPDDPSLDAVGGQHGRPAGAAITEVHSWTWDYDYATYRPGTQRIQRTEWLTRDRLERFRRQVKSKSVPRCNCWAYFGIK